MFYGFRSFCIASAITVFAVFFLTAACEVKEYELSDIIVAESDAHNSLNWSDAKAYCPAANYDGHTVWILPNLVLLELIYDNMEEIGGFRDDWVDLSRYWSSKEDWEDTDYAFAIDFKTGRERRVEKSEKLLVRCMRWP